MNNYINTIISLFSASISMSMYFSIIIPIVSIYGIFIAFKQFASNKTPKRYLGIQISDVFIKKSIFVQFLESYWFLILYFILIIWKPIIVSFSIQKNFINVIWYIIAIVIITDIVFSFYVLSKTVFKIESAYNDSDTIEHINKIFIRKYKKSGVDTLEFYKCANELLHFYNEEIKKDIPIDVLLKSYFLLLRDIMKEHCEGLKEKSIIYIKEEIGIAQSFIILSKDYSTPEEFYGDVMLRNETLMKYTYKGYDFYTNLWENNILIFSKIDDIVLKTKFFIYMYSVKDIKNINDHFHRLDSIKKISIYSIKKIIRDEIKKVFEKEQLVNNFIDVFYKNIICDNISENYVTNAIIKYFEEIYESENYERIIPFYRHGNLYDQLNSIICRLPNNSKLYIFFYLLFFYSEYCFRYIKGVFSVELLYVLTHYKYGYDFKYEFNLKDIYEVKKALKESDISHRINENVIDDFCELVSKCERGEYVCLFDKLTSLYNNKEENIICIVYLLLVAVYGNGYSGFLYENKRKMEVCKSIIGHHKEIQNADSLFNEYNCFS